MSTVQVGFSPVAAGKGVIAGASLGQTAAAAGQATPAGPGLGFVDALLDMLTQNLGLPDPTATDGQPATEAAAEFTATAPLGAAVLSPELTLQASGTPPALPPETPELLHQLVQALTAIDTASQEGAPVDPALEKQLAETADELAGLLGITLPTAPAIDTTLSRAATGVAQAIEGAAAPVPGSALPAPVLPGAGDVVAPAAPSQEALTDAFAAAVKSASVPLPIGEAEPTTVAAPAVPTTPVVPEASETPIVPADARLAKLIEKLDAVATRLETVAPVVAEKLQKLAQSLTSGGDLAEATTTALNDSLDEADIAALATPRPDPKSSAAPQVFTQPVLPNPAVVAKTGTPAPAEEARPLGAIAPTSAETPTETESPVRLSVEPAPTDAKVEGKAPERREFGQHLAEARAEPTQSQPAQTPTSPVKTEIGAVAPKLVHAAYQAPVQQVNLPQVAFEVVRQFNQGASRFLIRLDPPEMGRIDVTMKVDTEGNVQTRMTVERAETLDLMQRDQRALEKALAQAGLDGSKSTLEFSLRQNPSGRDGQNPHQQNQGNGTPFGRSSTGTTDEVADIVSTQYRGSASASGVNLFV